MIVVTGAAGFIGYHLSRYLLESGEDVLGVDKFSDYYGEELKRKRAQDLLNHDRFSLVEGDLGNSDTLDSILSTTEIDRMVHLAAQAGVQLSITQPEEYVQSNIVSFANVLESARRHGVERLIYASSSSVYGAAPHRPLKETDPVASPVSLYAATKVSNEAMAHAYSHVHGLTTIGLRFFTVYGPWGRPDMSYWKFYEAVCRGEPLDLYFQGRAMRDFTYVGDVARIIGTMVTTNDNPHVPAGSARIYNIGNEHPVSILELLGIIEEQTGRKAQVRLHGDRPGDVPWTCADTSLLLHDWGMEPSTDLRTGMSAFGSWYESYAHTE